MASLEERGGIPISKNPLNLPFFTYYQSNFLFRFLFYELWQYIFSFSPDYENTIFLIFTPGFEARPSSYK